MRCLAPLFIMIALTSPQSGRAQMPETPAGRQLSGWLAAFNSGNRDSVRSFYEQHYPNAVSRIDQMLNFHARTGGFNFMRVSASTPNHIIAYVQERASDQFATAILDVDSAPPHHIITLQLNAIERPPEFAIKRVGEKELLTGLRARLDQDADADRFSGAVLLARGGKTLIVSSYGLAGRERHIANTVDTRVRLDYMNKMFTATSVLQLVQAGQVQLEAPLITYIPDY